MSSRILTRFSPFRIRLRLRLRSFLVEDPKGVEQNGVEDSGLQAGVGQMSVMLAHEGRSEADGQVGGRHAVGVRVFADAVEVLETAEGETWSVSRTHVSDMEWTRTGSGCGIGAGGGGGGGRRGRGGGEGYQER